MEIFNQSDNESKSIKSQYERWQIFVNQWEQALHENKEVVVLGDMNLDFLNSHAYKLKEMSQLVFDRIYPHGVV